MAVEAARRLRDGTVCFVGIGLPSLAANLARHTHAPHTVLIYESGTIGAKPVELPLSIGDGELAETADAVVSVPEIFAYWLQGGRIDVSFLGAAQIDRHGNLNSTVIGDYDRPTVRLPGGGGAPEIALGVDEVFVMLRHSPRAFVERLDFETSRRRQRTDRDHRPCDPRAARRRAHARRHPPGRRRRGRDRRHRLGPARRGRRARDCPSDPGRAHRPPSTEDERTELMQTDVEQVVLPDDPTFGPEVQVDYPGYRSTRWRAPDRPLVTLPEEFHRLDGPVFGEDAIGELDDDLTRQHAGEPLGERIIVSGRVLDDDGRAIPNALVEIWQANAGGRYHHEVDQHPAPLDPNFSGAGRCLTDAEGELAVRHDQARRVPVGEPRQRLAAAAHPLLGVRQDVHAAAGHADVLPRRPAARARPDRARGPRPERARAAVARFDLETTVAGVGARATGGTSSSAAAPDDPLEDS